MKPRPLSTDIEGWNQVSHYDPSYKLLTQLPTVQGRMNAGIKEFITDTVSNAETWGATAGFSASAKARVN
jgi:hypothetical protein